MFNYVAYKLGGQIPYKVTQFRSEGNEQYVVFNGLWHNVKDCILCTGSGIYGLHHSKSAEIFEGDILRIHNSDPSCHCKDEIGTVLFREGKFFWISQKSGHCYSLAGKSWHKLGNIACDMEEFFSDDEIKCVDYLRQIFVKISGYYYGVLFEKIQNKALYRNDFGKKSHTEIMIRNNQKQAKVLLNKYKSYLEIKEMIKNNEIIPEALNANLNLTDY